MKRFYFFIVFLYILIPAHAQTWLWGRVASFPNLGNSNGSGVSIDKNNNAYITGEFDLNVEFGTYQLTDKEVAAYFVKYDPNGNVLWAKQDSSTSTADITDGNSTVTDKNGDVYFTGGFGGTVYFDTVKLVAKSNYANTFSTFLVKYDSTGKLLWAKQSISTSALVTSNGTYGTSAAIDDSGYIYVTGQYSDNIYFGNDSTSGGTYFITKYDSNGNSIWVEGAVGSVHAQGVNADNFGNIYVTGYYWDSCIFNNIHLYGNSVTAFLVKYNSHGQLIWAKTASGGVSDGYSVVTEKNGDIYVTGEYDTVCIFGSQTLPYTAYQDFFLIKYDSSGNAIWAKTPKVLDTHYWTGYSVATDQSGSIYCSISGYAPSAPENYAVAFGADTFRVQSKSPNGISIITKFDSAGNLLYGSILSSGDEEQGSLATDMSGNYVYMTGTLSDTAICGPDTLSDYNNFETYIARWQTPISTVGINEVVAANEGVKVYPNPSNGKFTISLDNVYDKPQIGVYNMLGEEVYAGQLNSQATQVNINSATTGLYLYRVTSENGEKIADGKLLIR